MVRPIDSAQAMKSGVETPRLRERLLQDRQTPCKEKRTRGGGILLATALIVGGGSGEVPLV